MYTKAQKCVCMAPWVIVLSPGPTIIEFIKFINKNQAQLTNKKLIKDARKNGNGFESWIGQCVPCHNHPISSQISTTLSP